MKIAVEGCAHGELEKIYECLERLQERDNIKIELLICCGDFQAVRNQEDLNTMAVPDKYKDMCTFYKYYSGEKVAPILTLFIGGNHEASNYLQELPYGGWVAPNIYYLGRAGVVNVGSIRIGGMSGIFSSGDYMQGHHESPPYNRSSMRSVYHVRNLEIFRLRQLKEKVHIMLSHDWPKGITKFGNEKQLLQKKPYFREDLESGKLGSFPAEEILNLLKPDYWFAAHMHVMFVALVKHEDKDGKPQETKFLALDKCLPKRRFLQIIDIECEGEPCLKYDAEWLAILKSTNNLLVVKNIMALMPGPGGNDRYDYTPTEEEKNNVIKLMGDMTIDPKGFVPTAPSYSPSSQNVHLSPEPIQNPQTTKLCDLLGIDDPLQVVLAQTGREFRQPELNTVENKNEKFPIEVSHTPKISRLSLPAPITPSNECFTGNDADISSNANSSFFIDTNVSSDSVCVTPVSQKKVFKRRNQAMYTPDSIDRSKSPKLNCTDEQSS